MAGLGSLVVRLGLDAADFVAGATKAEQQLAKLDAAAKRNTASINKQVKEYQQQAAVLGLSSREADLYKLRMKGATDAQLKSADAALRSVEAHAEWQRTARGVGLVAGLAAAGLVAVVKASIDGADHLNDLSKSTGVAVETLGGLGFAATKAGSDVDSVAASVGKLNLTIAKARAGDKDAAFVFKAVGLDDLIKSGASAEKVLLSLADKFNQYEDGPEKAALGNAIFGKSYQSILPLLAEGGQAIQQNIDKYRQLGGVTKEFAAQADQFNDTLADLGLLISGAARKLTAELLPGLQAVADEMKRTKDETTLLDLGIGGVRTAFEVIVVLGANVSYVLKAVGTEIGGIAAQIAALMRLDFKGFSAIGDAMKADAAKARAALDAFEQSVLNREPKTAAAAAIDGSDARFFRPQPRGRAPGLPGQGGSNKADDARRRQLEADLRLIREFGERQREAVEYAQRFIDGAYDAGTLSLRQTIDEQRRLREIGVNATISALDREVAARQAYIANLPKSAKDGERIQAESQLQEAVSRRSAAQQKAAQDAVLANQQDEASVKRLTQAYVDFLVEIDTLKGDRAGAAALRINRQVADAELLLRAQGKDPAQAEQYRMLLELTEQLSERQRDANRIRERAANVEEMVMIQARRTGATEEETLQRVGVARQKSLAELQALVDKANELARVLGTDESKDFAANLGLELERARDQADPVLNKWLGDMQEMGRSIGDSISGGFEDAILGARSLKDVVKGLEQDILRIVTRKLVTEPLGNYLSQLLGGNGGAGQGGGILGGIFGTGGGGIFGPHSGAGMPGGGGGGLFSWLGGLFGGGSPIPWDLGFAGGGRTPVRGGMFEVAEKRPEMLDVNGRKFLMMGNQRGTIDPMPRMGRGSGGGWGTVNNNFILPPGGLAQPTQAQFASAAGRGLMRARSRGTAG